MSGIPIPAIPRIPFKWIALVLAIGGMVFAAIRIADNAGDDIADAAKSAGALEAENAGHQTTLDQIGAANAGENEVAGGGRGAAAYDQCMRDAAPGFESGCEQYRPIELLPD